MTDPSRPPRGLLSWAGVFSRGMAMGTAELIPGVSGGTIAFITGIYLELVRSIRAAGRQALPLLLRGRIREAWTAANAPFLVVLGAGMGTAILALARLVAWLLEHRELQVSGFFFGLIAASALFVGRFARPWTFPRLALLGVGVGAGGTVGFLTALTLPVTPVTIFLGGAVAICAWILPGVSGSFVMLLLGLYPAVVSAISRLDLAFLAVLAAGCATGLLLFSGALTWLLERRYQATLALLAGFMGGSLLTLWPWRLPVGEVEGKTVGVRLLSPGGYEAASGIPAQFPSVVGAILGGVFIVAALERMSRRAVTPPDLGVSAPGRG